MLKGKIRLVNLNISEEDEVMEIDENTTIEEIKEELQMVADRVINILDDETSIYYGFDLKVENEEITTELVEKLVEEYERLLIIAEKENDMDYSVFFVMDESTVVLNSYSPKVVKNI